MKIFNSPAWDVDGSANTLYNDFSGDRKPSKNKKVHKKKFKTKLKSYNEGNREESKASGWPRSSVNDHQMKQEKIVSKNLTNSQQNKPKRNKMKTKILSDSANSGSFQTSKKMRNVKNSTYINKGNVLSPRMRENDVNNIGSHNQSKKKSQKRGHVQPMDLQRGHTPASKKTFASNFPKQQTYKDKNHQRGKKKIKPQNHNHLVPHNDNKNNRKRNANHLNESQADVQITKKRKIEDNFSHNKMDVSNRRQTFNRKHPKTENEQHSEDYIEISSGTSNDRRDKHAEKKQHKFVNNKRGKQTFQPVTKQMKGQKDNSQETLRSPYFGKNVFHDSSLPLRERMLLQLKSSRFRYINEQLYTSKSQETVDMFKKDPELFHVYHDGFQQQVKQWPLNPVEKIIAAIKRRPVNLVVADFGCGDATLAKSVPNKVHSFDLVALSDEVTVCDMAHTPLGNESVDICVFCLSLMGTNLSGYLTEANRVLTNGGSLKIAEVASRFDSVDQFIKDMKKYGFTIVNKDLSHELFYFLNFKKESNIKNVKSLPFLFLKPCLYKKR